MQSRTGKGEEELENRKSDTARVCTEWHVDRPCLLDLRLAPGLIELEGGERCSKGGELGGEKRPVVLLGMTKEAGVVYNLG